MLEFCSQVHLVSILLIAVGLAMDAFAVSIVTGSVYKDLHVKHALRMALFFGGFQAVMPLIGFLAGRTDVDADGGGSGGFVDRSDLKMLAERAVKTASPGLPGRSRRDATVEHAKGPVFLVCGIECERLD